MEVKVDKYQMLPISPRGAKNEINKKHWDPLRSILNYLLLIVLVMIPLCCFHVYVSYGFFSRRFAEFAASTVLVVLIYILGSKMIGADTENNPKKMDVLGVNVNVVLMSLNLILVPLRLTEVYQTNGLFSQHFAHFGLCAFALFLIHLRLSKMISSGTCMVLMLPSFISLVATFEWDFLFCIIVAGYVAFVIIISYMLMLYEKSFVKKSDCEDTAPSA